MARETFYLLKKRRESFFRNDHNTVQILNVASILSWKDRSGIIVTLGNLVTYTVGCRGVVQLGGLVPYNRPQRSFFNNMPELF